MLSDLRRDLTAALKRRDRLAVSVLRSALAAIENAAAPADEVDEPTSSAGEHFAGAVGLGAAEVDRRHLTDHDIDVILGHEIDERLAAAEQYATAGRAEVAERLRAEADLLRPYRSPASRDTVATPPLDGS